MKKYLFLVVMPVFLSACVTTKSKPQEDLVSSALTALVVDSLGLVQPDSLRVLSGPKTLVLGGRKLKLKKGATLIIQAGQGNTATPISKVKNSTLAVGEGAISTDNTKAGNKAQGGVALGSGSEATGSQEIREAGWPWYVCLGIALALVYGLYRIKKHLGF